MNMNNMMGMNPNIMMNNPMMGGMGGMDPNMMNNGMMPNMLGMDPLMLGNMGMAGMGNIGMNGMGNMGMAGMGNIGMNGMGNIGMAGMGNMGMVNMGMGNMNITIDDPQGWNLIFENQNDKQTYIVRISEQKKIKEAISLYRLKSMRTDKCKFILNSKELYPEMRICESGLQDHSKILVISLQNLKGATLIKKY